MNPLPISPLADDLATAPSRSVKHDLRYWILKVSVVYDIVGDDETVVYYLLNPSDKQTTAFRTHLPETTLCYFGYHTLPDLLI